MMVQKLETRGFGRGTDQSQFRDENYSPRTLRPSDVMKQAGAAFVYPQVV